LSQIDKSNLQATIHFKKRVKQRKNNIHPDINGIYSIILNKKPVEISKQDNQKFKLCYDLGNDYDQIIVISIINSKPLTINLVTSYIKGSNRRRRKDGERVESE
jgi:hypothetical protein